MTETAEISQSAAAQAGERLAKYIQLSERIKDAIKSSNDKCVEARALVARYAENEDAARKALEEQRLKLEQAESEYADAVSFLKRQNEALCEARLECTMLAIEGECIQFLIASAPDPSDSALRLSMGRTYLRDGCTALKLLNNELINNATSNFRFAVLKGVLMYLVETLNVLATIVPGDNVHIARRQFAVYLNNWKDEKHPLTELRENGVEFRARLDREWKLFVDMLGSVCKDAEVALSALQTSRRTDEADAGKPQRTKGSPAKRRPRRRRLLTLAHNEQLKKHGYEVKASRDTIVFREEPYLLTADKVVAVVNNLIVQLCTCPENPYIRFTSNDSKNFNRGAYRKFLEDCIVRKKHVDVCDSSVVITEPLAKLRT